MRRDQGGQVVRLDPRVAHDAGHARQERVHLGALLPLPDDRGAHHAAERPQRLTDHRRALQGRERAEEHHGERPAVTPLLAGRLEPPAVGAHRRDHGPAPGPGRQRGQVLGGVHDDDVSPGQGERVQRAQQPLLDPAPLAAVAGRARARHEEVEHHRGPPGEEPDQRHVEVPQVADEHRVGARAPSQQPGHEACVGPHQGDDETSDVRRSLQHLDPRRRVEPERHDSTLDLPAVRLQPLEQDPGTRVHVLVERARGEDRASLPRRHREYWISLRRCSASSMRMRCVRWSSEITPSAAASNAATAMIAPKMSDWT